MRTILSRQHPEIKKISALQTGAGRTEHNLFIAQGMRTCQTLLEQPLTLAQLYLTGQEISKTILAIDERHRAFLKEHNLADNRVTLVSPPVMEKISTATNASGILGVFHIPPLQPFNPSAGGLVLAQVSDPGNMGTLIRTAAAMNIKTVITVEGTDPWSAKVVQASAGTIGQINLFQFSWNNLLQKKGNTHLIALDAHSKKEIEPSALKNSFLVIGNEAHGIPETWLADCDSSVAIAMPGNAESLNAAVAGSIALYIMSKQ